MKKNIRFLSALMVLAMLVSMIPAVLAEGDEYYYANKYLWYVKEEKPQGSNQGAPGEDHRQGPEGDNHQGPNGDNHQGPDFGAGGPPPKVNTAPTEAFINSVFGEWEAQHTYLQNLGKDDEMAEAVVQYWASFGMKKELYHADDPSEAKYSVFSPMYQPEGKKFPLLVVCHGGGANIFKAESYGFIEEAARRGYIVLFISWMTNPYNDEATAAGVTSDAYTFKKAYDEVIQNYPIDTTRVYVAGFSGGGNTTAYIGATYPDLVAAIMPSTGSGIQGSAVRTGGVEMEDPLARAKEIGLALFMGYGLEDFEGRWPVSDELVEIGPHNTTTAEERLGYVNEWVSATGTTMEPTTMEQLAAYNAMTEKTSASAIFGLNFQKEYTRNLFGYDYYFGDGVNADNQVVVRFMGVPMAAHSMTMGWAGQFMDFAEHFSRDPETHALVVTDFAAE